MFCTEALYPLGLLCYYLCVSYKHGALNLYGARIDCKSIVSIGSVGSTPTLPTMNQENIDKIAVENLSQFIGRLVTFIICTVAILGIAGLIIRLFA